ncbi:MAG: zf-HC2 domain-containing protein [Acidobacteriota bacterium]
MTADTPHNAPEQVSRAALAAALAPLTEPPTGRSAEDRTSHPTVDELIAYQARDLSADDAESIREHLERCSRCLETLLDLDSFVHAPERALPSVADFETESAWRDQRGRLVDSRSGPRGWARAGLAAAGLLLVGLAAWSAAQRSTVLELRRQVASLSAPQPNSAIIDLVPHARQRNAGSAITRAIGAERAEYVVLVLSLPDPPPIDRVWAKIVAPDGTSLWRGPLDLSDAGTVRLGLWRRFLPAGESTIHLDSVADENDEAGGSRLASFSLRLPPGGDTTSPPGPG